MSSFSPLFSSWEWLDIVGVTLVFVGVAVGHWNERRKFKVTDFSGGINELKFREGRWNSRKRTLSNVWEALLIIGLALELIALPISLRETAKLEESNLQLRKQVAELERDVPKNSPIKTATAIARFSVSGYDLRKLVVAHAPLSPFPSDSEGHGIMGFSARGLDVTQFRLSLLSNEIKMSSNECWMSFALKFVSPSSIDSAKKELEALDKCLWYVGCEPPLTNVPPDVRITGGEATVILNTFVEKKFIFPSGQRLFANMPCVFLIGTESVTNGIGVSVR